MCCCWRWVSTVLQQLNFKNLRARKNFDILAYNASMNMSPSASVVFSRLIFNHKIFSWPNQKFNRYFFLMISAALSVRNAIKWKSVRSDILIRLLFKLQVKWKLNLKYLKNEIYQIRNSYQTVNEWVESRFKCRFHFYNLFV